MPDLPPDLDLPRIFELLADPDVGGKCWIENLTKEPLVIAADMAEIQPGERLYLGSYQRIRAATAFSKAPEASVRSAKWSNMKAYTFARIAALLQILYKNGCPLIDPRYPDKPIVFWDEEDGLGLAAWEQIGHLHNRNYQPYDELPKQLQAYFQPGRLLKTPTPVSATLPIDSAHVMSKYAHKPSSVHMSGEGMDLLKSLIIADMQRKSASTLESYALALIVRHLGLSDAEARRSINHQLLLNGLRSIVEQAEMPADLDSTFTYLAQSLRSLEGLTFGGNAIELLRYCGLYNNNSNHVS